MDAEWRVRLLRAWYSLRERMGHPRKLTQAEFLRATDTTLLAGSPWIWVSPNSTAATATKVAITCTTWPATAD